MGNIKIDVASQQLQTAREDGRGGHAVGVVVAVDCDPLLGFDRGRK